MKLTLVCLAVCALAGLAGCGPREAVEPDRVVLDPHASGDNQCGMHGETLPKPLRVVVEGVQVKGALGGKGSRHPAPGVEVVFRVTNPDTGAVFEASEAPEAIVRTNAAGVAAATLRLGRRSGDVAIMAAVKDRDDIPPAWLRATAGVELIGKDLEGPTGGEIDEFGVRLQDPDGMPAAGVQVHFGVVGSAEGSSVKRSMVVTGEDGLAVTSWKLGKNAQQYFAEVEIDDERPHIPPEQRFHARAIGFVAMATDKPNMVVVLLGGLAVFIFGMKMMSEGLQRMADRRLRAILQVMTRNRFFALGMGTLITAMVQSSSAVTVMTVGFVNAGLMTLKQAIGVIFGANIGTTVTAQIIAFKLEVLAYPAIALGLIMVGLSRKPQVKALGESVLGFGLLFLGMQTMSDILKPLRHSPEFVAWFRTFDCTPVAGGMIPPIPALMCIVIGTVTTVVIQSSSATVGLVLALSSQGLLSFYTAVPLVLGDNIGTTITAQLAALGANRNAKRVAMAHTLFNALGAAYMYGLLFVPLWHGEPLFLGFVDAITPGEVFTENPENLLRHVANAHTAFNVFNCVLFLPFVGLLARVCRAIIPVTDADRETVLAYLEPHLLNTPSLALQQAVKEVAYMVRRGQKSLNESCDYFFGGPNDLEAKILRREDLIDRLQAEITGYLVDLSRRPLSPPEAALLPALIHAVNDAERIGDHSTNLVELTRLKRDGKHHLSEQADQEIRQFQQILNEQFAAIFRTFESASPTPLNEILEREDQITQLLKAVTEAHVKRLEEGACEVQPGVIYLDFLAQLERIGDHLVNIAERAGKIVQVALR